MRARHLQALAGVTVLAAALRFPTLDVQSFWFDEASTVRLVRGSFGSMLDGIPQTESTPPLYYVLAWAWSKVFGTGEVGLRSLSALIGTLTVPAAYAAADRLAGWRVALVTAALVAVNPLLVWYSQEARAYALLVLLGALSLLLFARALEGEPVLGRWALVSALAVGTHYFAAFLVVPEALWLLGRRRDRDATARAVAAVGAAGLALVPLAIGQAENRGAEFIEGSALATRLAQVPKQFLVGFDAPLEALASLGAGALAAFGLWLLVRRAGPAQRRGAQTAAALAAAAIGVPLLLALAGVDYLLTRNLIAALLPCLVVLGVAFSACRAGVAAAGLLAALSIAAVVAVAIEPGFQRDDWRGAVDALGPAISQRAVVATPASGGVPLEIYLDRAGSFPAGGAFVREVGVVGIGRRESGEAPRPPRTLASPTPGPEFAQTARKDAETFTAVRFRAPSPLLIDRRRLEAVRLGNDGPAVLLERP